MRQISIIVIACVFLFVTGCGLIPFVQKKTEEIPQLVVDSNNKKSDNTKKSITKQEKQQSDEKLDKENTVAKADKQGESRHISNKDSVQTKGEAPKNTNLKPVNPPPGTDNHNNDDTDSDQKYVEAQKKADELKNTDQVVTVNQGDVYQEAVETSNVVQQVLKDQKVHVGNTQVDRNDNEIWCYVTGNDGNKDFSGWVSYSILR